MNKGGLLLCFLLLFFLRNNLHAQNRPDTPVIQVRNNLVSLFLSRSISAVDLASFTHRYNLKDIGLYQLIQSGRNDSLKEAGWDTNRTDASNYTVTKKLTSGGKLMNPSDKMIFYAIPTPDTWRIQGGNRVVYGVNDFKNDQPFVRVGNIVSFTLKGFTEAKSVRLAGNFTNWQHSAFPMSRTSDGWNIQVKLEPGAWYYKFILNENEWMTDPFNNLEENDGRGNINSVYYVPNKTIRLDGYTSADDVFISGTFNNWVRDQLRMKKKNGGWELDIYLEPGTHRYQYIVEGTAISPDEVNKTAEIGDAYLFRLKGFTNAKKVALAGNFNDWKPEELLMKKTADGWQLPFVLGPGNYMYKFIVDGKWITDPAKASMDDGKGNQNTFLVIKPNYRFFLRGHKNSKKVSVTGDFNDWNQEVLPMQKTEDGWIADIFLGRGKHKYKFIVDGHWITDPHNKLIEDNDSGSGNSVVWIE